MVLSEKLKEMHESGDFGKALEGFAEKAEEIELTEITKQCAYCGGDPRMTEIGKQMGFRPDIAFSEVRKLTKELDGIKNKIGDFKENPITLNKLALFDALKAERSST